jgi:carboxypeptidase T
MRFLALALFLSTPAFAAQEWAAIRATDAAARTALVNQGFSIETIKSDMSYGFAPASILDKIIAGGAEVTAHYPVSEIRAMDFPRDDSIYHNYDRMNKDLDALVAGHPAAAHKFTIGKSKEGRDLVGIRITTQAKDGLTPTALPGAIFMGGHHAREHLSVEVPLLIAHYLLESTDPAVTKLLETRDVFIIPSMNPDGAEFDIASGDYQMWRKNRAQTTDASCAGVDLNRNYNFHWGEGGSSSNACSEVYMGPKAFSEPETQAAKAFVESHLNVKTLLTFHTYSELILYPWGYTNDSITNAADLSAFEKMAKTMAGWNGYTPEASHELYTTTGDTVDWAYGTLGIFAFTFEMSPNDSGFGGGGFYPGAAEIQHSFQANLKPALYLIDLADNPHRAVTAPATTLFYGK